MEIKEKIVYLEGMKKDLEQLKRAKEEITKQIKVLEKEIDSFKDGIINTLKREENKKNEVQKD